MRKALINCRVFSERPPRGQGATAFLGGEAEGAGSVNPRQKKKSFGRKGNLVTAFQFPKEVVEMMESQQWKMRGYRDNEHKLKQEVQTGCKEEIFHEFNQASNGIGCPEWLWNPHIWRISRPTQMKPWATSSKLIAVPALSRRWELRPPEVPPKLSYTLIL